MQKPEPGRKIEIHFTDHGRSLSIDVGEESPDEIASMVVEAVSTDNPDEAEEVLRAGLTSDTHVERTR